MPSLFARTVLFLSGYLPLFAIFTVLSPPKHRWWALLPVLIGLLATALLFAFKHWVQTSEPLPLEIQSVQRKDAEVTAHLFAYVFPFLRLDIDKGSNAIGLAIFFCVLMVLAVRSNMIHINPFLTFIGWHLYEVTLVEGGTHTLLTRRRRLVRGTKVMCVLIGDDISMEKQHARGS